MSEAEGQLPKHAVKTIEDCWCCYRDRQMFKLLKQAISTADHSLTTDIMRKINPNEAELLRDPIFKAKIRFRFAGEEFPPNIVFKVFIQTNGTGVKYLCGKKIIKPASQAAVDSCNFMGNRKFLDQMLRDLCEEEQKGIIQDETELSNMKEYRKYLSLLDENTAESGGKANTWRTLTLDVVPRNHIISDVLVYLQHGTKTQNFIDYMQSQDQPNLVPLTQTQQVEYIKILQMRKTNESARRTKQAKQRAAKMKKLYRQRDEEGVKEMVLESPNTLPTYNHHDNNEDTIPLSPLVHNEDIDFDDELWEEEGQLLFEWTQNLSLKNLTASSER